jgi:DDE superfamily endonuclease
VALLAARAPRLRKAARDAKMAGHAYVVVDGTLIPIDRVGADRPFCSGKRRRHGMNLQVIASPTGNILWLSGDRLGPRQEGRVGLDVLDEIEAARLVTLADKGYRGSARAKIPYGGNKPESQKEANRAHALAKAIHTLEIHAA